MTTTTYGAKYQDGLSKTEIARLIRADLKAAQKTGTLDAGFKFSVRKTSQRAIDIAVTEVPAGFVILNHNPNRARGESYLSPAGLEVIERVEAIAAAYNFDGSDIQSDYFHVNFYATVAFSSELTIKERAEHEANPATVAAKTAERAANDAFASTVADLRAELAASLAKSV